METIRAIGISVRHHDAAALAAFTIAREDRAGRLGALAAALDARELVYLATCNRVEVYLRDAPAAAHAASPGVPDPRPRLMSALLGRDAEAEEAERLFWIRSGEAAVGHLFEVAAGLDSAQLGEREIQGQLRDALAAAREAKTSGVLLDSLVEEALRVARRVHLRTQLGAGRVSLAEIAVELVLERVRRTPSPVALVGVTPMTRRCAEILRRESVPFLLVNRTLARATALVAELGAGRALSLDDFRREPPQVEAILCATGAPGPVLDRAALERLAGHSSSLEPPLVIDLALPPDVDPEAARAAEVTRIGLDEINGVAFEQQQYRLSEAAAARCLVDEALHDLRRRLAERALAPFLTRIHQRYRETAREGVGRLLAKQGVSVDAGTRAALERWAETLARRFAHLPTLGLRGLAATQGMPAVRSFLEACDERAFAEPGEIAARLELLEPDPEKVPRR